MTKRYMSKSEDAESYINAVNNANNKICWYNLIERREEIRNGEECIVLVFERHSALFPERVGRREIIIGETFVDEICTTHETFKREEIK